jgi:hypothetical protein
MDWTIEERGLYPAKLERYMGLDAVVHSTATFIGPPEKKQVPNHRTSKALTTKIAKKIR